jgi:plastocyanin
MIRAAGRNEGKTMTSTPASADRRMPTLVVALAVPLLALTALVVTRAVEGPSSATAASSGRGIVIRNFAFTPKTLTLAPGTKVQVTNADSTQHTLTADNGAFATGVLAGGKHAVVTVQQAGTYRYHCDIHPNMTGTLVVR